MNWFKIEEKQPDRYDSYLTKDEFGIKGITHFNQDGWHSNNGKIICWTEIGDPEEIRKDIESLKKTYMEQMAQQRRVEEGYKTLVSLTEAWLDKACQKLCGVLDQLHSGYAEEDTGVYRTSYNFDADAVWFLKEHGYVTVSDGEWPRTKYLSFSFTDKFRKD